MGWSISIVESQIDKILRPWLNNSVQYKIEHPDAMSPRVNFIYTGKINEEQMIRITALFPDFVYVNFMKEKADSISTM